MYKECGSIVINGRKRTLYSKKGTTKKYVTHKNRKMNVVKYKKMLANKAADAKPAKPVKKVKKQGKKYGGSETEKVQDTSVSANNQATDEGISSLFKKINLGNF